MSFGAYNHKVKEYQRAFAVLYKRKKRIERKPNHRTTRRQTERERESEYKPRSRISGATGPSSISHTRFARFLSPLLRPVYIDISAQDPPVHTHTHTSTRMCI